jgi:hypothetical protein
MLGRSSTSFEVPLIAVPLDIDNKKAQVVADLVNTVIVEPVTVNYESYTWKVERPQMGAWITATVEGSGEKAKLVASIDIARAYAGLQGIMGEVGYGSAQNAWIDVASGAPVIMGGLPGTGPDLKTAANELQEILFGGSEGLGTGGEGGIGKNTDTADKGTGDTTAIAAEDTDNADGAPTDGTGDAQAAASQRIINCSKAEVEPAVTAADVAAWGIIDLVATYQLGYGSNGGTNREFNIERCLNTLNGSLIAPGQNWNWNDVVGNCDIAAGYKDAGAINDKNELVQEPGGGICNVATGVFNAAYEAGLPVLERANHSLYMANYPLGRDAAVSWQYPTLVFKNDTERHILVTARYDGSTMFISIWGTSPHRRVESQNTEWEETSDGGRTITNHRKVYAESGAIWFEDSFRSYFPPKKEDKETSAGAAGTP